MENTIQQSWSLVNFSRRFKKAQMGAFENKQTKEKFTSLIFTDSEGNNTFVNFSSKLGELSISEIQSRKDNLQVVQSIDNQGVVHHYLCNKGEGMWTEFTL